MLAAVHDANHKIRAHVNVLIRADVELLRQARNRLPLDEKVGDDSKLASRAALPVGTAFSLHSIAFESARNCAAYMSGGPDIAGKALIDLPDYARNRIAEGSPPPKRCANLGVLKKGANQAKQEFPKGNSLPLDDKRECQALDSFALSGRLLRRYHL